MLNLTVVSPDSLASILKNAVARRATSPDSVVTAELSQYFQTGRHRAYQVSTSAALVQGVSAGAVSSRKLANGDFGLGTFEHLDGDRCLSAFTWTTGSCGAHPLTRTLNQRNCTNSGDFDRSSKGADVSCESRTPSYALAAKFRQLQLCQAS
jgi:Alpha-acetolactate decarboxylase